MPFPFPVLHNCPYWHALIASAGAGHLLMTGNNIHATCQHVVFATASDPSTAVINWPRQNPTKTSRPVTKQTRQQLKTILLLCPVSGGAMVTPPAAHHSPGCLLELKRRFAKIKQCSGHLLVESLLALSQLRLRHYTKQAPKHSEPTLNRQIDIFLISQRQSQGAGALLTYIRHISYIIYI